jgi:hypothetical protein
MSTPLNEAITLSSDRSESETTSGNIAMVRFNELPDDILIAIIQQTALPTLLALRRCSKSLDDLINEYILSIAQPVARNTFLETTPRVLEYEPESGRRDLQWLLQLIPEYLATVIVDRLVVTLLGTSANWGIPATDDIGDRLRVRVADGLRVMMQLSYISKEVYAMPAKEVEKLATTMSGRSKKPEGLKPRSLSWSLSRIDGFPPVDRVPQEPGLLQRAKTKFTVLTSHGATAKAHKLIKKREYIIKARRVSYLQSIWITRPTNFTLAYVLLWPAFHMNHNPRLGIMSYFDRSMRGKGKDYFDWGTPCYRNLLHGDSWVTRWILHEGPLVFWHQWCPRISYDDDRSAYIRDLLLEAWENRDEKQIEIERDAIASYTGGVLLRGTGDAVTCFDEMWRSRQGRERSEEEPSVETKDMLDEIPYLINFTGEPM